MIIGCHIKEISKMTQSQYTNAIVRLIKILGRPHSMLILPLVVWDEHWDGIRVFGKGYELFSISEIPLEDREKCLGAEEFEEVLECYMLYPEDEAGIQSILENILLEG